MKNQWAEENLQVIRTLIERSAVYRRALAPIMIMAGTIGVVAAGVGWKMQLNQPLVYFGYWLGICLVVMAATFFMMRSQALRDKDPLFSPPTKRVIQAFFPMCVSGFVLSLMFNVEVILGVSPLGRNDPHLTLSLMFNSKSSFAPFCNLLTTLAWVLFYGCGIHSAGFFMPRSMKWLGWIFIIGIIGLAGLCLGFWIQLPYDVPFLIMGFFFGFLHLAYGIYLYFTEQKSNET